jgi:hypothetical protein
MKRLAITAVALAVLAVLGLMGSEDVQEEVDQTREYCEMVQAGHWGAYQPYIDCNEGDNNE